MLIFQNVFVALLFGAILFKSIYVGLNSLAIIKVNPGELFEPRKECLLYVDYYESWWGLCARKSKKKKKKKAKDSNFKI